MFKKTIISTVLSLSTLLSVSALAGNSQYGVISEIRYNTPTEAENASIVIVLENDTSGFHQYSEYMGCYGEGVENWYVNLNSHSLVVEKLITRLEKAEQEKTIVRLFGDDGACDTGSVGSNDTIHEAYFYKE